MASHPYSIYNIAEHFFPNKPGNPSHCPKCFNQLNMSLVEPSAYMKALLNPSLDYLCNWQHLSTHLFHCNHCEWWSIRDCWELPEFNGIIDYLIVGKEDDFVFDQTNRAINEKPWEKALTDLDAYDQVFALSPELVKIFVSQ